MLQGAPRLANFRGCGHDADTCTPSLDVSDLLNEITR